LMLLLTRAVVRLLMVEIRILKLIPAVGRCEAAHGFYFGRSYFLQAVGAGSGATHGLYVLRRSKARERDRFRDSAHT
jgi:hypothetical protein